MSAILVLKADGSHSPVEESAVLELLRTGQLNPGTFYWREGMTEWRPLQELTAPTRVAVPSISHPVADAPPGYRFARNPNTLTLIVKIMLGASFFPALTILFQSIVILIDTREGDFRSVVTHSHQMQIAAFVSIAIYLMTAIPFAMWIYRANVNCRGFGARLKYSPAMSVGGFFVPFANLVIPCAAMQEIWKASRNPIHFENEKNSVIVGFWWGFWLLNGALGFAVYYVPKTKPGDSVAVITSTLETVSSMMIAVESMKIVLCAIAFAMVYHIIRRQKELTGTLPSTQPR